MTAQLFPDPTLPRFDLTRLPARSNTRAGKAHLEPHNRKPGASAFLKDLKHRRARRRERRYWRGSELVRS